MFQSSSRSFFPSKLKAGRSCFQDLVSKHSSDVDEVTVAFTEYVGLLRGLVDAPEGGESKLRGLTSFKWTSTCLGRTPRYVWGCSQTIGLHRTGGCGRVFNLTFVCGHSNSPI